MVIARSTLSAAPFVVVFEVIYDGVKRFSRLLQVHRTGAAIRCRFR